MSLKHAILVLLQDHPGSGYDLMQRFRSGIGHFWNSTHQQVYQELKALSAEKWVEHEVHSQDEAPDKKVYRVTRAGARELKAWYAKPVKPPRLRDALLVKVYGARAADVPALLKELAQHQALHCKRLEEYRGMEAHYFAQERDTREQFRLPYLTLRRGIRYEQDCIEWLDETVGLLEGGRLPTAPVIKSRPGRKPPGKPR